MPTAYLNMQFKKNNEIFKTNFSDFLGNALAFMTTPIWDEPFGLSGVEAMATGTPLIANRRGAMPEVLIRLIIEIFN